MSKPVLVRLHPIELSTVPLGDLLRSLLLQFPDLVRSQDKQGDVGEELQDHDQVEVEGHGNFVH